MFNLPKITVLLAVSIFLIARGAAGGTVFLLPGSQVSNTLNAASETDNVASLPFTAAGGLSDATGSSTASYHFTHTGFDIAISQLSLATGFNGVAGGELLFSSTTDLDFQLRSSFWESNGLTAIGRIDLIDLSTGSNLSGEGNEGFVSMWDQNVTGQLRAGHSYSLRYQLEGTWGGLSPGVAASRLPGNLTSNTSSTVSASVQFALQPTVVPLPAAAWMGMALLGSVGGVSFLRKRRQTADVKV